MNSFQAYLIGLAQTDGSLHSQSRNRGKFTIELQYQDIDILKKIGENIECNYTIGSRTKNTNYKDNYKSAYIRVCDWEFRKFLENNGVPVGKKSHIIKPPVNLDPNLHVDYLRGLIDGDGSIGITAQNKPFLGFVTDSEYLKDFFVWWMEENTERKFKRLSRTSRDNIYQPVLYNEDAQEAVKKIYYSDCIALNRKLSKAKKVIEWDRPENMKKRNWEVKAWDKLSDAFILSHTVEESSKELNRTIQSIKCRKYRLKKVDI